MWYSAIMVVASRIEEVPQYPESVDLQVKVLRANSPDEAYAKALEFGETENISYLNEAGQTVQWTFEGLYDLIDLGVDEITEDTEVFNIQSKRNHAAFVQPKENLSVFWNQQNANRLASSILDEDA